MPLKIDGSKITFTDGTQLSTNTEKRLGEGQTWQDVIGSRVSGTTYTNNTGRTIAVFVRITNTVTSGNPSITVGGVVVAQDTSNTNIAPGLYAIVPAGATYLVSGGVNDVVAAWKELRT